jgi:AraC-like DNA-binding protein
MPAQLQLRDWSNVHADLAWIYEGVVEPEFRHTRTLPHFLGAWLMLTGEVVLQQGSRKTRATAGDWLIIRQESGVQRFSDDARILSIRFTAEWPDRQPFFEEGLSTVLPRSRFPRLVEVGHALLEVARPHLPPQPTALSRQPLAFAEFVAIRQAFWTWFVELHAALGAIGIEPTRTLLRDDRVIAALRQLDRLPFSTRLREGDLAEAAGLQAGHFVRIFRQEVGRTPKRYFDERRRASCRRLLAGSEMPIKAIALDHGFRRLSDFSAWFRSGEGTSPRDYRQAHQHGKSPV